MLGVGNPRGPGRVLGGPDHANQDISTSELSLVDWRFRSNSGTTDATPVWEAAAQTGITKANGVVVRLRMLLQEQTGVALTALRIKFMFREQGALPWSEVTTSSVVQLADGSRTDADAAGRAAIATNYLTPEGGVQVPGDLYGENSGTADGGTCPAAGGLTLTASNYIECEVALQLVGAEAGAAYEIAALWHSSTEAEPPVGSKVAWPVLTRAA